MNEHEHLLLRRVAFGQGHKVFFAVLKLLGKVITTGFLAPSTAKVNKSGSGSTATAHGAEDGRGNARVLGYLLETDADVLFQPLVQVIDCLFVLMACGDFLDDSLV
jgi:hypothetical protein